MTKFLAVERIIELQEEVLRASGGSFGIRDRNAIESAAAQPQMAFGGAELYSTLAEKAAALSFSLIKNHAFVDGNKRIGWVAMRVFLALNGHRLSGDVDEQERVVLAVAAGEMSREDWTVWVVNHLEEYKS